jgi:hypothetical protein
MPSGSSMPGERGNIKTPQGEKHAHIAQGQGEQQAGGAVFPGGAACSVKQYARGGSITELYIVSLHEIENNFFFLL